MTNTTPEKSSLSFVLFSYNEDARIEYAIRCFRDFGPVIIMDGGSTDKTKEIAESLGALFLSRPASSLPQSETQQNFDFIKKHTNTPWIYWGYVDNIAPRTLAQKLVELAEQSVYKKVMVPMYTYLWGETSHPAQISEFPATFHRDYMDFSDNHIHHMGRFTGAASEILTLPPRQEYALRHFSTYTIGKFVAGHMRYAEEESHYKFESGEKFSLVKTFLAMIRYCYIFRRSVLLGRAGVIIMVSYAFSRFMVYARLFEREHDITLASVENSYSVAKEKLLSE
ncbi:hypothetical protein A3C89_01730 [Candidatus Kaiserbacteria bacterium RIFCSPHIGHO2_02_FULL_50_50]|uniref:Glycosyltransferase 2-like domain-containing protein n=1 Tax=Candidatus Kaiserbacteria bacterium RIFCSPHIGHO2_02_FULL_50_50 TaxID=1798492 RepID=A0A1F6DCE8_9BACT|nr:MAG: hypothetical protein A3C89_01730 [Candidatus Kaiserbacteria bacterium RIFCSPHIGHO2_02_FULL_50_50]OGG88302.1 MAG: hypothetical protein A3G62_03340 [Candidatus Kaiserbacteria bacterium RIFCSPLOWO2_12_FULL_50_10]